MMPFDDFYAAIVRNTPDDLLVKDDQAHKLYDLMVVEQQMNERINLTRITGDVDFLNKNILDSLACVLNANEQKILDVGTGGGFPGLPLAICNPDKQFTIIDATAKKVRAVQAMVEELSLYNVTCIAGRAEEMANDEKYREQFDVVTSRAVAALNILDELCLPFVKVGGRFCAWKGEKYQSEIDAARSGIMKLGADKITVNQKIILKNMSSHVIIQCDKNHATSKLYPRNYGRMVKKPLV